MRGSKFSADMHNYVWCPIYIPSFMIIGSVVSEELRWQDFGTDRWTDGRSDCTPRPCNVMRNESFIRVLTFTLKRGDGFAFVLYKASAPAYLVYIIIIIIRMCHYPSFRSLNWQIGIVVIRHNIVCKHKTPPTQPSLWHSW